MHWDILALSRLQFAFTIMFHYLFPPLSIGLGMLMVFMEGMYLKTKNPVYEAMAKFWTKIFALNFSMGVATGIVMEFEFGTNWANYSRFVGDVFGSALAAEGIFAFFLESGFLAVLVFGWEKVSPKVHFFSTFMVALGAIFSGLWINIANSWQQTPAGFHLVRHGWQTRAEVTDFWAVILNPSSIARFSHAIVGGWILGAFVVMSISAFYIIRRRHPDVARRSFLIALIFAALSTSLQIIIGSRQAEIVSDYQPAKLAAFEGHFKTGPHAPMWLFGIPDNQAQQIRYGIAIPGLLSFLAKKDANAVILGLDAFPKADRPPLTVPFTAYHTMVAIGLYLFALSWYSLWRAWRNKLFNNTALMRVFVFSVIAPYVANELGWVAAEVGRQPWIVYGLLRTKDAVSHAITADANMLSLLMFAGLYLLLLVVFIYSLDRKIKHGPEDEHLSEILSPPNRQTHGKDLLEWFFLSGQRITRNEQTGLAES